MAHPRLVKNAVPEGGQADDRSCSQMDLTNGQVSNHHCGSSSILREYKLSQVAVTAGIGFGCATFISTVCAYGTSFEPTPRTTIGIFAGVLYSQALTNTFGTDLLPYINDVSVCFHAFGTMSIIIAILAKAPVHQSASFVFTRFIDNTGVDGEVGWGVRASNAYVVIVGYTLLGYDSSAHLIEETHNAAMAGSVSIIMAIAVSAALGWFLILGLLFSMQDLEGTVNSETGLPVMQIFLDTLGRNGAFAAMAVVICCMYLCGPRWKSPLRTGLPSLGSEVAFAAATSIATIGLYISYAIPIALRVIYHDRFVRGPFHLGKFSYPVAVVSVCWIIFITVAFIIPQINPVNSQTFNYASVAVAVVSAYSVWFWLLSARKWFTGPVRHVDHDAEEEQSTSAEKEASGDKL
ncbi:GABA transporter [Coprinopsis cinerea okayama7|uniref:GABA transporter n=1 Tax=Coprinopsis cinerea (strain Okayama-7 / 130 / ATCC MYA-4618 / FGSC 9003) TaxID=240176 RepID=A8PBT6_COPC7|nr:GABA transporter [Coprinopsis cinerea okayama7\|eukprot:XP_001840268.2 GABA transporter [Coprinopsis cinerea okayama7\